MGSVGLGRGVAKVSPVLMNHFNPYTAKGGC